MMELNTDNELLKSKSKRIWTPASSFVASIDILPNTSVVNMKSGKSYTYTPQSPAELQRAEQYAEQTGHFGGEYWTMDYLKFYQGRRR